MPEIVIRITRLHSLAKPFSRLRRQLKFPTPNLSQMYQVRVLFTPSTWYKYFGALELAQALPELPYSQFRVLSQ
jgi:hypothetical protein